MVFSACLLQLVSWALIIIIQDFNMLIRCARVKWLRYKITDMCRCGIMHYISIGPLSLPSKDISNSFNVKFIALCL